MSRGSLRLWSVPLLMLGLGFAVAIGTLAIDRAAGWDLVSQNVTGTPTAAQTLLSTIITSLITLISVVLTVMTVAVQLSMGQFSPRIVTALLADRAAQFSFGLFGAATVYAALALRGVDDARGRVPGLTVVVAYALAIACLAALVLFVGRASRRLRASGLIDLVGDQLHVEIERQFPDAPHAPAPAPDVLPAAATGIVSDIDHDALVALAERRGCVLHLQVRMGDFVASGSPMLRVEGAPTASVAEAAQLITLHDERTHELDPAFGLRKLVDISIRSASDDPTTTVEALHRIHEGMRQLAVRSFPSCEHRDASGTIRLTGPVREWDDFVLLAFEEIRLTADGSPQIARRLRAALLDLLELAPPERRPALEDQLELLDAAVRRRFDDDRDARVALGADAQGLG
jgi:uncharacterized membrane protein